MVCAPYVIKYLQVRAPAAQTLLDFTVPLQYQNGQYLRIPVSPNQYSRIVEGEKSKLKDMYASALFSPRLARVGFKVTCTATEFSLYACLEYIAKVSVSTGYTQFTAVQVIDYCRPEAEDYKASILSDTEPFTIRYGLLSVDESSGTIGTKGSDLFLDSGFSFSFVESNKRLIV